MESLFKLAKKDIALLKEKFPDLDFINVTTLPTAVGRVIHQEFPESVRDQYSLRIKVVYPEDFPDEAIRVYDLDGRIKWDQIPFEHRHCYLDGSLCTHHYFEIEGVKPVNRSFIVIHNALRLFYAYKHFKETGEWFLDELPHGAVGTYVLLEERSKVKR